MKIPYKHEFEALALAEPDQARLEALVRARLPRGCRRVLLVNVPQVPEHLLDYEAARAGRYSCFPPYGLAVLAGILRGRRTAVDILDLHLAVLERAQLGREAFERPVWREQLSCRVAEFAPDMVGLSCMFNMGHEWLKAAAEALRAAFPMLPVAAGGVHPTLTAAQVLEDVPAVDFVFLYEADRTLPDFVAFANGEAPGSALAQVAARDGSRTLKLTKRNLPETLDAAPDWEGIDLPRYTRAGRIGAYTFLRDAATVAATALSTRGCRAQCGFCSVRSVNGPGVRTRGVEDVVAELRRLRDEHGVRHVMWLDDDLFYDRQRACELFEAIAAARLGMTWDASNGIIAAALDARLLAACVASGCAGFNIGVESGNPEMLRMMKKPGSVDTFRRAARLLRERAPSIFTKGFLMLGFPGETIGMMNDTVRLAVEMGMDWYPSQILTPMPGTPIYQLMEKEGLLGDIPTTVLGKARTFSVGATGTMHRRERAEKHAALSFRDLLAGDQARVPERGEMEDIWFVLDYRVNYEPMLGETDPLRLRKKAAMLDEICERMTTDNPLGRTFLALSWLRLGAQRAARAAAEEARRCLDDSEFWQARFDALGIRKHLEAVETALGLEEQYAYG